ncbi:MAG: hypothetical protein HGA45_21200 [Chloroflexales bacterium]|nr:hypothetical protein [Chloroflexales bacterium]
MGTVMAHATRQALRIHLLALLAVALTACAGGELARPAIMGTPAAQMRAVDLSHVVREDVPYPPGEPPTHLARDSAGRLAQLTIGARTGSLLRVVAAPDAEPTDIEGLSPRDLVLAAVVIDARDYAQDTPAFALSAADVLAWEQAHGPIPRGALVLLTTGWDVRWGDPEAYLNTGPDGAPRVPGFAPAAADLLLNQRGVAGLGVDAPATAHIPAAGFSLMLENLTSLEQLPPTGATIVIGALKLQAAESSPARVIALVP